METSAALQTNSDISDKTFVANAESESAMEHFGKLISLIDLPSDKKMIA